MTSIWILCLFAVSAVHCWPVPENVIVQEYASESATSPLVTVWRVRRSPEPVADPDPRHHHHYHHGGYGGLGGYGGYGGGYNQGNGGYGGYGGYPGGYSGYGGSNSQASANSFSAGFNGPFGGAGFSGSSAQASSGSNSGFYG